MTRIRLALGKWVLAHGVPSGPDLPSSPRSRSSATVFRFEIHGHCAVMTIDRPQARNAVNGEVAQAIEDGIDRLENSADLWVGLITGAGSAFCSGADLKQTA